MFYVAAVRHSPGSEANHQDWETHGANTIALSEMSTKPIPITKYLFIPSLATGIATYGKPAPINLATSRQFSSTRSGFDLFCLRFRLRIRPRHCHC